MSVETDRKCDLSLSAKTNGKISSFPPLVLTDYLRPFFLLSFKNTGPCCRNLAEVGGIR